MGWETRRGGYRYYVRSTRRGGRVEHRCFRGVAAAAAAAADERRRAARAAQAAARRRWRDAWAAAARPTAELTNACRTLMAARLLAAGYRQHARGQWRKTRRTPMPTATTKPTTTPPTPPAAPLPAAAEGGDLMDRLGDLSARAQGGDSAARAAIRELLEGHPEVWTRYGDLARHARDAWAKLAVSGDPALAACVDRNRAELAGELGPPGRDPLERLLAEWVAVTHLQLQLAALVTAETWTGDPAARRDAERRQASAQHAFLQAARTLAACRKLLKPPPSPLDLLRPVGETSGAAGRGRSRLAPAGCGAG
jgi:hypothetical protein